MNPLTRSLSLPQLWRCVPGSVGLGSGRCVSKSWQSHSQPVCGGGGGVGRVLGSFCVGGPNDVDDGVVGSGHQHQQCRHLHTAQRTLVEHKIKTGIQDSLSLLGVAHDCSDQELREAYLAKVKDFHPDSPSPTADPYKFRQVKDAYRAVLEYRKGGELEQEEEEEAGIVFDIRHTAPQHRQYLEFEGVGYGTPSQRQRQYRQHRVARGTENVFQHRMQKLAAETEDALVVRDKQQAKKTVISNALERIVEDLIQESMKNGDFNDLPGQGKPLEHTAHNPFVDVTTHNLNKILVNNGFAPEWIMLQGEIRKEIQQARQTLALIHSRLPEPRSPKDCRTWREALDRFRSQVSEVNLKVQKFNLIVPFLEKQKMPYRADREVERVLSHPHDFLPQEGDSEAYVVWDVSPLSSSSSSSMSSSSLQQQAISWRQVWRDIRSVFRSSDKDEKAMKP